MKRQRHSYWFSRLAAGLIRRLQAALAGLFRVLRFPVFSPTGYRHVEAAPAPGSDHWDPQVPLSWFQRNRPWLRRLTGGVMLRLLALPLITLLSIAVIVLVSLRTGRTEITQFPDGLRLYYESVDFASEDGTRLSGWFVPSLSADDVIDLGDKALCRKRPGVVLCHGIGGNRSQLLPLAAWLNRQGFEVLLFDFRACGLSTGNTRSLGLWERSDALAAAHYLAGRSTVDPRRLALIGIDVGGFAALGAAARDHSVRAVALINTDSDLRAAVARKLGADRLVGQLCTNAYVWGFQSYFRAHDGQLSAVRLAEALAGDQSLLLLTSKSRLDLQASAARITADSPAHALAVTVPDHALTPFVNPADLAPVLSSFLGQTLHTD